MTDTISILDLKQTARKIESIKGRTGTMTADIQAAAIGALAQFAEHGNATLMTKLVNAVTPANATQLRKYFAGFAPVVWNKAKGFSKAKKGGVIDLPGAIDTDWSTYQKEAADKAAAAYSRAKVFSKLAAQFEAAMELALDAEDIPAANQLAEAFNKLVAPVALTEEQKAA